MWDEGEWRQPQLVCDMGYAPCKASLLPFLMVDEEEGGEERGGEQEEAGRMWHPSAKCKTNQALQRDVSDFRCEFHVAEMWAMSKGECERDTERTRERGGRRATTVLQLQPGLLTFSLSLSLASLTASFHLIKQVERPSSSSCQDTRHSHSR